MGNFENTKFDRKTIEPDGKGGYDVYGHGTYEQSSVLAGRAKRAYLDNFPTIEAVKAEYPDATSQDHSSRVEGYNSGDLMPKSPPEWFDPMDAGEAWGEDDY